LLNKRSYSKIGYLTIFINLSVINSFTWIRLTDNVVDQSLRLARSPKTLNIFVQVYKRNDEMVEEPFLKTSFNTSGWCFFSEKSTHVKQPKIACWILLILSLSSMENNIVRFEKSIKKHMKKAHFLSSLYIRKQKIDFTSSAVSSRHFVSIQNILTYPTSHIHHTKKVFPLSFFAIFVWKTLIFRWASSEEKFKCIVFTLSFLTPYKATQNFMDLYINYTKLTLKN